MQFTFHAIFAVSAMVSLAAAQGNGLCNLRGEYDTCSGEFSKACENISGTGSLRDAMVARRRKKIAASLSLTTSPKANAQVETGGCLDQIASARHGPRHGPPVAAASGCVR
ncbi:uncharacterized protein PG986_010178 [Apiospora aurea]|uniref:Uncharacterized protein n=1 Tax=Apiospora aurea TaxID=335848 RepID=A0ABR1Q9Q8_9PEZI